MAAAAPQLARAQSTATEALGRTVTAIHIEIEGRREEAPDLRDLIESRVGAPLDAGETRESIAQLFAVGRFDDIRVNAVPGPYGVAIVYHLTPRHPVSRVRVRGDTGISASALREALETRFEALVAAPSAAEATTAVVALLRDEGYLGARATMQADVSHAPHETTLTFDVAAGSPASIGEVRVDGEWTGTAEALLARLQAQRGQPYRRAALSGALDALVSELREAGRYAASASHIARPSEDGSMAVVIEIDAGPEVEVRFEGDPLPRDRLDALVPVERERAVDLDLLEDATIRIVDELRRDGYWRARAVYRTAETDGRLTVTFVITRGPRYRLGVIDVDGNQAVSSEALLSFLEPKSGDIFLEPQLARGAAAIRDYYRRAGFASAEVGLDLRDDGVSEEGEGRVDARLSVTEGAQSFVRSVAFTGVTAIGEADLRRRLQSRSGDPYYVPALAVDRDTILRAYLDRGYQQTAVDMTADFDAARTSVALTIDVREGPQTTIDRIIVVGNVRTDLQTILDELTLRQGGALGLADLVESQRRLSALGLFRRVRIAEGPRQPGSSEVDLVVTIEEAPPTTIGVGGGIEVVERSRAVPGGGNEDRFEIVPRGFLELTRRNIAGGNRALSLFTRVSLGRDNAPGDPTRDGKGLGISEYRLVGSYREPRAFRFNADLLVSGSLERALRTTFSFNRRTLSAEMLRRVSPSQRISGRYALEYNDLFDVRIAESERLLIDRLFPQVRLSILSISAMRDTRTDPVDPERGALTGVDLDLAPRALGSEVGFVKGYGQAFVFRRLPSARRLVFAAGARVGLARGFSRVVEDSRPLALAQVDVREIPASQRFFSGGSTTVRGFQIDRLGVPGILNADGLSNGGNAMIVLNAELRATLYKDLGAVAFLDAGNVFAKVADFDIAALRPTAGVGIRYKSPIGPLRVDLGFKLDRESFPHREEHRSAWHFSLGQAF